jgi:hypothetical protein
MTRMNSSNDKKGKKQDWMWMWMWMLMWMLMWTQRWMLFEEEGLTYESQHVSIPATKKKNSPEVRSTTRTRKHDI